MTQDSEFYIWRKRTRDRALFQEPFPNCQCVHHRDFIFTRLNINILASVQEHRRKDGHPTAKRCSAPKLSGTRCTNLLASGIDRGTRESKGRMPSFRGTCRAVNADLMTESLNLQGPQYHQKRPIAAPHSPPLLCKTNARACVLLLMPAL